IDADCSAKTLVSYFYRSNQPPASFKPFDPAAPRPADLERTTTSTGQTVDYIVRREKGTINRAIYEIAFLHVPGQPIPDPWTAAQGWNGRLVYSFGGGCRAGYRQAASGSSLNDGALAGGYAVALSSLNVFGNNCDDTISAETMMMVKEHFIKTFGVPVHTIGWGGSGGSMQQHLIAQNYPGLLDGITPSSSYPDITSVIAGTVDCSLLDRAFNGSSVAWTEDQKTAVSGFATWRTCATGWMRNYSPSWVKADACEAAIAKPQVYNAASNPGGTRCGIYDNQANLYGRDPSTGFARRPLDNVGVQYGLAALRAGKIDAEQFVQLNERAGGYDADGNLAASRTAADPAALRSAYEKGRVNSGGGSLGSIPVIDWRNYMDNKGDIHDRFRSFSTRARLAAANGRADNQVILTLIPSTKVDVLSQMNKWLDNIAKDTSGDNALAKVVRNKPAELTDACWTADGEKIAEPQTFDGKGRCNELYPNHSNPRIVAGAPLADNILKCALKAVDANDYPAALTSGQLTRLKQVFPQGVCDYSRPGVGQQQVRGSWFVY
ncbi:MAG: DUF6351 family protein, partial [Bryobacteraceae bacterium]